MKEKILVIDDEAGILRFLEKAMKLWDYSVKVTDDPLVVLDILKEEKDFELVITDLRMPKMDGLELIGKIRPLIPNIAIIVITANATLENAIECLRKGANDYLIKPFELSELKITIEKVMEEKKNRDRIGSLEELNRLKDEFISTISHELRTPLMGISGALELIIEEIKKYPRDSVTEVMRKSLAIIDRQTQRMKKMVKEILDYAKMEAGYFQLEMGQVVLEKIILEAIKDIQGFSETKKIVISSHFDAGDTLMVYGDANALKQTVINLLSNAVKYSPVGGKIDVQLVRKDNQAEISVKDNGIGLEKNQLEKIFEKFYRVDQSLSRSDYGIGLGLSIARKIVELHNGKIWAESPGPGRGTEVKFTIPLAVKLPDQ